MTQWKRTKIGLFSIPTCWIIETTPRFSNQSRIFQYYPGTLDEGEPPSPDSTFKYRWTFHNFTKNSWVQRSHQEIGARDEKEKGSKNHRSGLPKATMYLWREWGTKWPRSTWWRWAASLKLNINIPLDPPQFHNEWQSSKKPPWNGRPGWKRSSIKRLPSFE